MNQTAQSLEHIRSYYGLDIAVGQRVRYYSKHLGTIKGAAASYILVQLDGDTDEQLGRYHPTWEMEYL